MTGRGGTNADKSRIALGRVAQLLTYDLYATAEELSAVPYYELIPEPVREAIEGLTPTEHLLLRHIFQTLADSNLPLVISQGGAVPPASAAGEGLAQAVPPASPAGRGQLLFY